MLDARRTQDRVIGLIETELDRDALAPQERLEFIQAGEWMVGKVGDRDEGVREANERTFSKIVAIAAGAAAGVLFWGTSPRRASSHRPA